MSSFGERNPFVLLFYYAAVSVTAMAAVNPLTGLFTLFGALALNAVMSKISLRFLLPLLLLFLIGSLINPLFYHNGVTILFFLNNNPITLEALLYGISASLMLVAVIVLFRAFSLMMTADKLLYLLSSLSPKTALLLSSTLRFVPLFGRQMRKIEMSQKALGLFEKDNAIDSIRSHARVGSILLTWALENGIVTADSMEARGYGIGKRTSFSLFRFRREDGLLLLVMALLFLPVLIGLFCGAFSITYYPQLQPPLRSPLTLTAYASHILLVITPILYEGKEKIKWHFLRSSI